MSAPLSGLVWHCILISPYLLASNPQLKREFLCCRCNPKRLLYKRRVAACARVRGVMTSPPGVSSCFCGRRAFLQTLLVSHQTLDESIKHFKTYL